MDMQGHNYVVIFQSPPSVRKATSRAATTYHLSTISIPAFREEGDPGGLGAEAPRLADFNPRLP